MLRHPFAILLAPAFALFACNGQPAATPGPAPTAAAVGAASPNANPAAPTPPAPMPDQPTPAPSPSSAASSGTTAVATLANGCFWCTEAVLEQQAGVLDVTSGYMGGENDNPTYQQVCSGLTGHAECVQVTFDPKRISYSELLDWFFRSHDPTTLNRQGADEGTQYRSAIFFHDAAQKAEALAAIKRHQPDHRDPIVTAVTAASRFWPAEDYHQGYFQKNSKDRYCRAVIAPKLKKLGLQDAK
jgi:peptide-methionine (S)-S-oxide reductase